VYEAIREDPDEIFPSEWDRKEGEDSGFIYMEISDVLKNFDIAHICRVLGI